MFWFIAATMVLIAGMATLWPLFRSGSRWRLTTMASVLAMPLLVYWLYLGVGTPQALSLPDRLPTTAAPGDMEDLTESLRQRLEETPEDLEGWLLLSRSYKTLQRYPEALQALETASRIAPDEPIVMVEKVEAELFVSGNPRITPDMVSVLERSVAMQPGLQKGLWLLGIAAVQSGEEQTAIDWWQQLLDQVDPGSPVAASVTEQIREAQQRAGLDTSIPDGSVEKDIEQVPSLSLVIRLDDEAAAKIGDRTPQSALFVVVRQGGVESGPPLGVRRIEQPEFPVTITITDQDSMLPQRPIFSVTELSVQARLSLRGQPLPQPGDWQSEMTPVSDGSSQSIKLSITQQVE